VLKLEAIDRSLLDSACGRAAARAMRLLVRYGEMVGARRFVSIASAHVDGCLYQGPSGDRSKCRHNTQQVRDELSAEFGPAPLALVVEYLQASKQAGVVALV
jgi:Aconitase X